VSRRIGLRTKMTASYVLVTAAAVVIVEAIVIGVVAPTVLSGKELEGRVQTTATGMAGKLSLGASRPGKVVFGQLGEAGARLSRGEPDSEGGLVVPEVTGPCPTGPFTLAVLVDPSGTVLATSAPACYPVGDHVARLPGGPIDSIGKGRGTAIVDGQSVVWAGAAVEPLVPGKVGVPLHTATPTSATSAAPSPEPTAGGNQPPPDVVGFVYVQSPSTGAASTTGIGPFVRTGLLLLLLTVAVGAVFGFLTTRRLTRRLAALARTTEDVAAGDFTRRVPVSGTDEVSQLGRSFNTMAERLSESSVSERRLTESNARLAERSRIARELHDSISQDLFSLNMLAGGLRKALPADAPVRPEVDAMEATASRATREMQALLLELRPIALEDAGLAPALDELCRAYRDRLGVRVDTSLELLDLSPAAEHAVLRVAQEALANAVRHGDPHRVSLAVAGNDGMVEIRVTDDGRGFDANGDGAGGMGLRTMRERVEELGGTFAVSSTRGAGTVVDARIPRGPA